MNGNIIWRLSFSVRLTSLSMIISRSIHVAANGIILFFFYSWVVFHCVYIYIPHLLYPFIRHLGFHILAIVSSAAMNLGCMYLFDYSFVQVYAQEWDC